MSELSSEGLYPKNKRADSTVRRLASGILIQALRDLMAKRQRTGQTEFWRRDALDWFFDYKYYPGGLLWVCEILACEADEIRSWVRRYRRARGKERQELAQSVGKLQLPKGGL